MFIWAKLEKSKIFTADTMYVNVCLVKANSAQFKNCIRLTKNILPENLYYL